jgi:hypothetical protein
VEGILAWAILSTPMLAIALPIAGGVLGLLYLWRTRSGAERSRAWAVGIALGLGVVTFPVAFFLIALGHMWSPSRPGEGEIAGWAAGIGALVALAGLAGYAAMDRRGSAGAGFGVVLGPLVLMVGPLLMAPILKEVGQGTINTAYVRDARTRAAFVHVAVDDVTPTVRDGDVQDIQLSVSITADRTLTLYQSADQEVEWGLLHFVLIPPGQSELPPQQREFGALYAESPVGMPGSLNVGESLAYDLDFDAADPDAQRSLGTWELVMQASGSDGLAYEVSVPVEVGAR